METFQRVLITGSGGMLGEAVFPFFRDHYPVVMATDINVRAPWLEHLDITDSQEVHQVITDFQPDLVLHLAALVDMERCEEQQENAQIINADATRIVAEESERVGATVVYISTAGVFDGQTDEHYTEEHQPNPICVYGATKYGGEVHVREICSKYFVTRPGWMVGGGKGLDRKFVAMILDQLAEGNDVIYAVTDKSGTPTYTYDFARTLHELLKTTDYGDYHTVCKGSGTRFDVAREILDICRRDDVRLEAVGSDFFMKRFYAPRPPTEILVNKRLQDMGIDLMRHWRDALREYIPARYSDYIAS